ncbi:Retrovirus-related Pol polyprotein from transposon 412 [Araneus ventricosus]|uniref:RNA-directed DNA polymerase n=1 Tax=Araneus ventricosus TaxID=182803 RepID=A0A4Y2GKC8_ARAVE|nr:Retrovirus-related Pol polyprotein from transposon 412 [Araneus ventricosus]
MVATIKEPEAIITDDPHSLTLPPAEKIGERIVEMSSEELREAQRGCSTLQACFLQAERWNSDFRVEGDMLFKESKDHFGNVSLQVVIPQVYRDKILALCHEGTSSHLGVRKTKDRLLKHYFWPNCIKEIEGYVRSCDTCQRMEKGNDKIKAPLKLVPIITEVFSKMNIDAVGPFPTSLKGNSYLLTAICMSLRYPDAIPVADISSISVTDALLEIFSRMGLPREIQSDLGSSFTSFLTSEFFDRFGIKVTHSSVHHPQSNPVERFHRTIKRMLKVLCLESGQDWEKNLPATLLALRTITHDSTGFSPAELVHRKNLRTPEVLLYEHWVRPQEEDSTVTEYIFDLINRMRHRQELAVTTMTETRDKRKTWYDKNTVKGEFRVGELVLALATSKPNKMAVQWTGPGVIESKLSETNYIVRKEGKKGKTQIYHINLLKPYHQRLERVNLQVKESGT